MYRTFLAGLFALGLAACSHGALLQPTSEPTAQADQLGRQQREIEAALGGLTLQYLSESEYPWTYNPVAKPSVAAWLADWQGQEVEQRRTFRYFFRQLKNPLYTNIDAERYRRLEQVLRRHFGQLTVYWVIDPENPAEVRLFILGQNRFGVFALETISIET